MPLFSVPNMRRVACSRSGSRSCAWTWLMQQVRTLQVGKTHDFSAGCCGGVWGAQVLKTHATNSLRHICISFCHEGRYFSPFHEGLALCFARLVLAHFSVLPLVYRLIGNSTFGGGFCVWAAALGLLEVRVVYAIFASAHFLVGFRSVTPCCCVVSILGTLEQSHGPFFAFGRSFCEFATTLFHCWSVFLHPRYSQVCSFSFSRCSFCVPLCGTGLLSCSCSTSLYSAFFAAESGSSYHQDAEITLERERCGPSRDRFVSRKKKDALSASFSQKREPFHLGEACFQSCKKPVKCLEEFHSLEQQHANTHRLFIKLCWLMSTHAVSVGRVVNIDEISCCRLPVHQNFFWWTCEVRHNFTWAIRGKQKIFHKRWPQHPIKMFNKCPFFTDEKQEADDDPLSSSPPLLFSQCVHSTRLRACRHHAHMYETCARVVLVHTETFRTCTRGRVEWTRGFPAYHSPHTTAHTQQRTATTTTTTTQRQRREEKTRRDERDEKMKDKTGEDESEDERWESHVALNCLINLFFPSGNQLYNSALELSFSKINH